MFAFILFISHFNPSFDPIRLATCPHILNTFVSSSFSLSLSFLFYISFILSFCHFFTTDLFLHHYLIVSDFQYHPLSLSLSIWPLSFSSTPSLSLSLHFTLTVTFHLFLVLSLPPPLSVFSVCPSSSFISLFLPLYLPHSPTLLKVSWRCAFRLPNCVPFHKNFMRIKVYLHMRCHSPFCNMVQF